MPLTEFAAATAFYRSWYPLCPGAFLALLSPVAHYASQWVFDEMASLDAIADYLRGNMKGCGAARARRIVRSETWPWPSREAIRVSWTCPPISGQRTLGVRL